MTTAVTEPTAAAHMVATASNTIYELEVKRDTLGQQIAAAQAKLAAFAQEREVRAQGLAEAQSQLNKAEVAATTAREYAKLAIGTPNHEDAVKTAAATERELLSARKKFDRLQNQARHADEVANAREQELHEQVQAWQVEQAARQDEIAAVMLGKQQAHRELGIERHVAYQRAIQDLQRQSGDLREQMKTLDVALHDLVEEAVSELVEWSELRRDLLRLHPPEDATAHLLQSTIEYVEALASDFAQVNTDWNVPVIPALMVPHGIMSMPGFLAEKKQELQQVLDAYRVHLIGE